MRVPHAPVGNPTGGSFLVSGHPGTQERSWEALLCLYAWSVAEECDALTVFLYGMMRCWQLHPSYYMR